MRRTALRLLGIAAAGGALLIYFNATFEDDVPSPETYLTCGDRKIAAGRFEAGTSRETRTPAELATLWARKSAPDLLPGQRPLHQDATRVDIGFDLKASTVAVLTFESHPDLGWQPTTLYRCV